jgi:hypothetical protein
MNSYNIYSNNTDNEEIDSFYNMGLKEELLKGKLL